MNRAIYAGSFDPITNGHVHIAKCGLEDFDLIIIAIATNFGKKHQFSASQRIILAEDAFKEYDNIVIQNWQYAICPLWARMNNSRILIRGIRNIEDEKYEEKLAKWNHFFGVQNQYYQTTDELREVSSSRVRKSINTKKWEQAVDLVPNAALLHTMV